MGESWKRGKGKYGKRKGKRQELFDGGIIQGRKGTEKLGEIGVEAMVGIGDGNFLLFLWRCRW